ncbi:Unconventional myosin-Ie [Eumeta japonica]|uniref:Unconventional myosin-Ie n=1 Tax=Eumeta variegata TaxID=151549 RepID=A0A4C1Y478_EUMVA|nr:Unconventional myosin-Ie [Eumeta japonica]
MVEPAVSCVANYAYEASEADELSLRPGDVLRDVERLPGGWWRGELRGRRGMFPDNFVTVLNESTPNSYRSAIVTGNPHGLAARRLLMM